MLHQDDNPLVDFFLNPPFQAFLMLRRNEKFWVCGTAKTHAYEALTRGYLHMDFRLYSVGILWCLLKTIPWIFVFYQSVCDIAELRQAFPRRAWERANRKGIWNSYLAYQPPRR